MATEFVDKQWRIPNSWNVDESNQGKISNYSMEFNGTSDFVDISVASSGVVPSSQSSWTYSAWLYLDSGSSQTLLERGSAFPGSGILVRTFSTTGKIQVFVSGTALPLSSNAIPTGVWSHFALVYDISTNELTYCINNSFQTVSMPAGWAISGTLFNIGKRQNNTGYWLGKMDQVSVFDYALPQTGTNSIATLYGNNSAGYFQIGNPMALTPNPVAFYPLGDQDVQQTVDSTDWRIPNQVATSLSSYVFNFTTTGFPQRINIPSITIGSEFTASFWFNSSLSINDVLLSGDSSLSPVTDHYYPFITTEPSGMKIVLSDASGTTSLQSSVPFVINTWFHIVITQSGGTATTYINGGLSTSGTARTFNLTQIASRTSAGFALEGQMSNVALFNTPLPATGTESVASLYNNGSPALNISSYSGLQRWYKLNDQDTFNSGTSTWTIKDYAGSNDGTSVNMTSANLVSSNLPNAAAGYSPWAIDLNGTSQFFKINDQSLKLFSDYITVSLWYKAGSTIVNGAGLYGTAAGTSNNFHPFLFQLAAVGTDIFPKVTIMTQVANFQFETSNTNMQINKNQWNYLAAIYDGSTITVYANGNSQFSTVTGSPSTLRYDTIRTGDESSIFIANRRLWNGNNMELPGVYSNVAVWNSGLSSSQIATIYNNGIPGDISSLNPLAWWELGIMTGFNSGTWTAISNSDSNFTAVSTANMTESDLVNGPGYSSNAIGTSTLVLEKQAPYSFNNALSENMSVSNRDDSQASDSSPLTIELDLSDETGSYVYSGAVVITSAVYPYTVDWGDGNVESITSSAQLVSNRLNHTYNADEYPRPVVQIGRSSDTGRITQFQINNGGSRLKLVDVKQFGTNTLRIFDIQGCTNAIITALDKLKITENLTDAFRSTRANPASINTWDVSTIGDMQYLVSGNNDFNQDLNNWDTSSATNMFRIFFYARKFNGNVSNWNINSVAKTHLGNMFSNANSFNQDVDTKYISAANSPSGSEYIAWDTDGFTTMTSCFSFASPFNGNCSNWNTSAVTSMSLMFYSADLNQDLSTRTVTIASGTPIAKTYKAWDVKNVTNFQQFLDGCSNFNQVLYDWELNTNLTSMHRMFRSCSGISASNYAKNWGIFANSVIDNNSVTGGAASGFPREVLATLNGLNTTPLSVGEPCPISSDGDQHFTTVGRAMSYLTSDVRIIESETEPNAVQLYTANFLQSPSSDFPTQLIGVTDTSYTFDWSGTQWDFKKTGSTVDSNTGATLTKGPSDLNGSWNTIIVSNENAGWNYGKGTDPGNTYMI